MNRGAGTRAAGLGSVIFLHIPKTAGTSTRRLFRAQYPRAQLYEPRLGYRERDFVRYLRGENDDYEPVEDGNAAELDRWERFDEQARHEKRIFLGHFWYGVHERLPGPATYVTVVRDPVERSLSLYNHRLARHELAMTPEDYLRSGRDLEVRDAQTRRLATGGPGASRGPVTQTMLDVAKEHLLSFGAVGTTERLGDTMVAFARLFEWKSLQYEWANRGDDRLATGDLEPGLLELLQETNRLDTELHRFAGTLLDQQLDGVDAPRALRRLQRRDRFVQATATTRRQLARVPRVGRKLTRPNVEQGQ